MLGRTVWCVSPIWFRQDRDIGKIKMVRETEMAREKERKTEFREGEEGRHTNIWRKMETSKKTKLSASLGDTDRIRCTFKFQIEIFGFFFLVRCASTNGAVIGAQNKQTSIASVPYSQLTTNILLTRLASRCTLPLNKQPHKMYILFKVLHFYIRAFWLCGIDEQNILLCRKTH
jgi:hypothetical protein